MSPPSLARRRPVLSLAVAAKLTSRGPDQNVEHCELNEICRANSKGFPQSTLKMPAPPSLLRKEAFGNRFGTCRIIAPGILPFPFSCSGRPTYFVSDTASLVNLERKLEFR